MLTVTLKTLNETGLAQALVALNNSTKLEGKTAYRVGRIMALAEKKMLEASKVERELLKKHAKCGDDGKPLRGPDGQEQWNTPTSRDDLEKELDAHLEANTVEIKVMPLDFNIIVASGLVSGRQLVALEPLMSGQPAADEDA